MKAYLELPEIELMEQAASCQRDRLLIRLLQEHLGHLNFNTTARYRKIAGEEHRKWYDGLWR